MRKLKSLVLAVMGLLCCMSVSAHDFEVDGIYYNITSQADKTVAVTYRGAYFESYSNDYSGEVKIPESVTYNGNTYSVTRIEAGAFSECSSLTSVEIPNSVTSINYATFSECSSLTSVEIPNSVTSIGADAFYDCSSLTSVEIPNSVTSIGADAFYGTAWYNNQPDGVVYAGKVLYKYKGTMPANTSITIEDGTVSISPYAFSECSSLTSVEIPNSVTSIGDKAFYGCSGLTFVVIGNGVTSIGSSAFLNCSKLRTVINNSNLGITKGSTDYGYVAYYADEVLSGEIVNGFLFDEINGENILICHVSDELNLTLPESYNGQVYKIGDSAFRNCSSLTSVEIPNSVTSIGNHAFYGCSSLTFVVIGNGVTSIDNYAFKDCSGLRSMTIGTGVLSIGSNQCTPKKVIWLTNTPPSGCSNLKGTINYVANNQYGSSSDVKVYQYLSSLFESDGVKYVPVSPSERTCDAIDCSYDSSVETINIGETVSYRGIAMTVLNVMPYLAYGQTSVTNATIANKGDIGESAFKECSSLSTLTLGENVTSIGERAFDNCTKLADVIIADRTTDLTLGSNGSSPLFSDCPLDSVYIGGNISYNTSSSYGYSPFYRNTSLRTVVITDKEEEISDNEFYGCTNLKNVTIGGDVKKIGKWAFSGCSNLDYFSFGKSVETIGQEAFSDCVNLKKLISYAEVPPTCGSMALDDINKWDCVLQVPQSCLAAYQQADQWKEFFFIEDVLTTAIGGVTVDGAVPATADVYSTNGMLVKRNADLKNLKHELPAGIYIIGGKKVYVR